ncbi:thioredoxin family protein [Mesonia aquimarina]|uniref:thioredoxin family protein n=1 Tax=Mesonia aquimarina TaxID=1504967 RepID=UPI000EF5CC95|nr:thioredoxin fold domain-containing protein [Mesonia aquimarina]
MKNFIAFIFLFMFISVSAQRKAEINWMSFEQLEDSLQQKSKKTLVYFYADWCVYCKKMDRNAFKNSAVVKKVKEEFYAVKMNAETSDTIYFDGIKFYNDELEKKRNPTHQLAKLLASREGKPFALPAIILLDENFKVITRSFTYLTSKSLQSFLVAEASR